SSARPAVPAPAPRSSARLALGAAAASRMASCPARWPLFGCSSFSLPPRTASSLVSISVRFQRVAVSGIRKQLLRARFVVLGYEQAARQKAERAFHHAHVLVGDETMNVRRMQQRFDRGDQYGVVGADELMHKSARIS